MGKRRGHYCKVCSRVLPNEKFSGKVHSIHICKKCSKKSPEERREQTKMNNIYSMSSFMNLSKNNKRQLQKYLNDESKKVRDLAQEVIDEYSKTTRLVRKEKEEDEGKISNMNNRSKNRNA